MTARPSGPVDAERSAKPRDVIEALRRWCSVPESAELTAQQEGDHGLLTDLADDLAAGRVILLPVGQEEP